MKSVVSNLIGRKLLSEFTSFWVEQEKAARRQSQGIKWMMIQSEVQFVRFGLCGRRLVGGTLFWGRSTFLYATLGRVSFIIEVVWQCFTLCKSNQAGLVLGNCKKQWASHSKLTKFSLPCSACFYQFISTTLRGASIQVCCRRSKFHAAQNVLQVATAHWQTLHWNALSHAFLVNSQQLRQPWYTHLFHMHFFTQDVVHLTHFTYSVDNLVHFDFALFL